MSATERDETPQERAEEEAAEQSRLRHEKGESEAQPVEEHVVPTDDISDSFEDDEEGQKSEPAV